MPQSLSSVVIHLVFSTKDRVPTIDASIRPDLFAYLATVSRNEDCDCFRAGGVADHVHMAIRLGRTTSVAHLIEKLKTSSSKWIKGLSPSMKGFAWQRGYGAFSVGASQLDALIRYIDQQEEHHRAKTFQEEYRELLMRYSIPFDERYVWD